MRFKINVLVLYLILHVFSVQSQNTNLFTDTTEMNRFKLNFFLDEIKMYEYFFYIDHDNRDDFILYNQKNIGDMTSQKVVVHKGNEVSSQESYLGERFEKFDDQMRLVYRKDSDKDSEQTKNFIYNDSSQITAIRINEKYIDGKDTEVYNTYFKLMHYRDSLIIMEKDEDKTIYERVQKYHFQNDKVIAHNDYFEIMGMTHTINFEYNDNGYRFDKRLGYQHQYARVMTYYENDRKVIINHIRDDKEQFRTIYKFDQHDNIMQIDELILTDENDEDLEKPIIKNSYTIQYTYDATGNWTKMQYKNVSKEKEFIFTRTINYR